jgi:uncharacterized protein
MLRGPGRLLLLIAAGLLLFLVSGRALAGFYTDALWFGSLGHGSVFWTRLGIGAGVRLVAGLVGAGIVLLNLWIVARQLGPVRLRRRYGNLEIAEQVPRSYVILGIVVASVLAGWWLSGLEFGGGAALGVAAWLRSVPWGMNDPLFGRDLSFFVFALPAYFRFVDFLLLTLIWSLALLVLGYVLTGAVRWRETRIDIDDGAQFHFVVVLASIVLLLAVRYWLGRYGLVLEGTGYNGAVGYTDVHARLPAQRGMALLSVAAAFALLYGGWRRSWVPPVVAVGTLIVAALLVGHLYPQVVQRFRVEPNELAREAPYIEWNLEFTRHAYGLDAIDSHAFPYRRAGLPAWSELGPALSRLPLWDPEPLRTSFNQIQSLLGYYHFPSVDFDRYGPPGGARQTAIGIRELNIQGLAEEARTWQTLRLNPRYIRGFGAVVTPAAQATGEGIPMLWVRDMPVESDPTAPAELTLTEPSVYFGETMGGYIILVPARDTVFLGRPGEDFPAGIRMNSFPRVLALAWRFGEKNLLFSGDVTGDSYFVFRRNLGERLREIAPFLLWDSDPLPVVHNGRIVWLIDGYTASPTFPMSRALQVPEIGRVRYLRGSVKATIDAVTGLVTIYALDNPDPVLETYRRVFPELIRPLAELPAGLERHLRYPSLLLRAQALLLGEYHLERPEAFYAKQDVWDLAQESGAGAGIGSRPLYALLRLPGEDAVEFVAMLPFIARQRLNMTALLVARNDPPHYGRLALYELPRDQQVPGPSQVEAIMEQDPVISQQLSLWRAAGSNVDLGRLRVVPVENTFLYVQPLFLSAQGNPIPSLRRVIASDGQNVRMASSLAAAVEELRRPDGGAVGEEAEPEMPEEFPEPGQPDGGWRARALELMEEADRRLRAGDWAGFGARWAELQELLRSAGRELP